MQNALDPATREKLLADPSAILEDRDMMRALVGAREADLGDNVIDIRGRAMEALETRLDRLENTHEQVIAMAYENQSGMAVIHRAVLSLLEPISLSDFIGSLQSEIAPILRIDSLRLIVESDGSDLGQKLPDAVKLVPEGTIVEAIAAGRRAPRGDDIVLRAAAPECTSLHGQEVASEALIPLDLGPSLPDALLLMGSHDAARFGPAHGTDLLRFFAQAFRLNLIRWLQG